MASASHKPSVCVNPFLSKVVSCESDACVVASFLLLCFPNRIHRFDKNRRTCTLLHWLRLVFCLRCEHPHFHSDAKK